ncbi:MAG TPA: hypothetical protein ENK21_03075 [Trueperaceae bacterium]|nr:hypothetical protein [Trueperaceae bacterium]
MNLSASYKEEKSLAQHRENVNSAKKSKNLAYNLFSIFILGIAVALSAIFVAFGHKAMELVYSGQASGLLAKVNISAKLPLNYYLERADWLVVGTVLMLASLHFLVTLAFVPNRFARIAEFIKDNRILSFTIAVFVFLLASLLSAPIAAFNLIRIVVLWLSLAVIIASGFKLIEKSRLNIALSSSLILVLLGYVIYIFSGHTNQLGFLFDEDTVAENLQAVFYGFAGLLFLSKFMSARQKIKRKDIFYLLFAAFLLLVTGEEVSWGQRIFKLQTPEFWDRVNVQGEITLHNFRGIDSNLGLVIIMLTWAVVIPVLNRFFGWARAFFTKISMPVMPLTASVAVLVGISIYYLNYSNRYADEIWELFASLSFIFFAMQEQFSAKLELKQEETLEDVAESEDFVEFESEILATA